MKFGLIAIGILLLVQSSQWTTANAQLQGPQVAISTATGETDNVETSASTSSNLPATDVEPSADDSSDVPSTQRKASKYIDDQLTAAKTAAQIAATMQPAEAGDGKNKLLQFAIFERLWNEEVVRKKLQEQIETIESQREPANVIDPTPEQIIGMCF